MSTVELPPWERIFDYLQNDPSAPKKFSTIQRSGCNLEAIIIALWNSPNSTDPSRYLAENAVLNGWPNLYLGQDHAFPKFGDPTRFENPKIYRIPKSFMAMVIRLRTECDEFNKKSGKEPLRIGCALWQHPEDPRKKSSSEFLEMKRKFIARTYQ